MYDFHCWADVRPARVAVTMADSGVEYTAGELAQRSRDYAQWLASQGIDAGDTIAVLLENRVEILDLALAARLVGAYIVVISTHLTAVEVSYIVRDCGAKMLFVSERTAGQASKLDMQGKYLVDEQPGSASLQSRVAAYLAGNPAYIDLSDRPAGRDLLYSSGTTGSPKGIKKALFAPDVRQGVADPELSFWIRQLNFDENTVYLSTAPLYHAAPLRTCLRVLNTGGRIVIMERFDAEKSLALIDRHRVTHSQWVPTMFQRILALPQECRDQYDVSSQKYA
ncbi:MAG: AMP-binding protein, partial [Alcaligenaceae bacterium]|nr:AMP-binding protein [Alcaligenaceae bacterium]